MADTQETTADIIAEMRLGSTGGMPFAYRIGRPDRNVEYKTEDGKKYEHRITVIEKVTIDELAGRLEAAHKREAVTGSNQLREALRLCMGAMCKYCVADAEARGLPTECVHGCEVLLVAKDALAAPPRNCDKVNTSWDVLKEWHEGLDTANDIVRMLDWLLAPATETEGGVK